MDYSDIEDYINELSRSSHRGGAEILGMQVKANIKLPKEDDDESVETFLKKFHTVEQKNEKKSKPKKKKKGSHEDDDFDEIVVNSVYDGGDEDDEFLIVEVGNSDSLVDDELENEVEVSEIIDTVDTTGGDEVKGMSDVASSIEKYIKRKSNQEQEE